MMPTSGEVLLVGAGPGDPELLTLKAVKALARADVILVDNLVGDGVLAYANPRARIIHVGKRGGCASTPQDFIERLMIAEARRGHTVVRLKGGDPFLFGRGGEEREAVEAAGIAVEVVSGVSSAFAAAAATNIPLTHRACAPGVAFVTGHAREGGTGADWRALAATRLTLVIYMGIAKAAEIQAGLLAGGLAHSTPVAVVQDASLPHERTLATRLDRLAADIATRRIASPAIIIVGEVAAHGALARRARGEGVRQATAPA